MINQEIKQKIYTYCQSFSSDPSKALALIVEKMETYKPKQKQQEQALPKEAILITYGDQISNAHSGDAPLKVQSRWLKENLGDALKAVHILPCFPYSSDDGFSVKDYRKIEPSMGNWDDIDYCQQNHRLMFDAVVNHCSQHHLWFQQFLASDKAYQDYFIEADWSDEDYAKVTRPRTLPLFHEFNTAEGNKKIWTTFSKDQVDLNFASPALLAEMIDILLFYVTKGAKYIRLDAITFAIKKQGTNCATLKETHDLVKLMRLVLHAIDPSVVLITETNVPHHENISYFGNGNEAQAVYNFALPPLIIHSILSQNIETLASWLQNQDEAPKDCAYFNITATHDGIGLRGASKELGAEKCDYLAQICRTRGGQILSRSGEDGQPVPYELNITFFDMLKDPDDETASISRFMLSQYLALSMKGIPGVYFHNLLGSPSWQEGFAQTNVGRTLNRKKFQQDNLDHLIAHDPVASNVFNAMKKALYIYHEIDLLGPDAAQEVTLLSPSLLQIKRQKEGKSFWAIFNFSDQTQQISLLENLCDQLTGQIFKGEAKLSPWQVLWLLKEK